MFGLEQESVIQGLNKRLPTDVWHLNARFRTSSHRLKVETGRWKGLQRQLCCCDLCGTDAIQDQQHVMLECSALDDVRSHCTELLGSCGGDQTVLTLSCSDQ